MERSCEEFSKSISPITIPVSNEEIRELLNCLQMDVELYLSSLKEGENEFVIHFKESILPVIEKKGFLEAFIDQLVKFNRVLEAKTVSAFHGFHNSSRKLWDDIKQVSTLGKYKIDGKTPNQYFTESLKIVYADFSNLATTASQLFFALEFYCKVLCSLGCLRFALSVAKSQLIHHNRCRKQLRRFQNKKNNYCGKCEISDKCMSKIDFDALYRIYAYSMKIRQIADYRPKFISFDIMKSGLIEPPFVYFESLKRLLREKSMIHKSLANVAPRFLVMETIEKELTSPFIWGDEAKLKQALREDKDNDFYNYLLGRYYYEKDRLDESLKYLTRARDANPSNADVWKLLGTLYDMKAETKTELEKAIHHYRKAKELEPNNCDILLGLGVMELAFGNRSAAFENLIKANESAKEGSTRIETLAVLSEAHKLEGSIEKSKQYLEEYKRLTSVSKDFKSELYLEDVSEWLHGFISERRKVLSE